MKIRETATYQPMRLIAMGVLLVAVPAAAGPVGPGGAPTSGSAVPAADPVPRDGAPGARSVAPITEPVAPCQVRFTLSRVPQEVRAVIDTWVRTEMTCGTPLDVSIEPAEGGYAVHARDARGGMRVRIVPDADTIGVLIASWSADDRIEVPAVELRPPSLIPAVAAVAAERRAARSNRQIMLSGFMGDERGGRVQVDLFGRLVPFGIAIATQVDPYRTVNFQATLYSGIDLAFQRWHLRAQVGAGLRVNDVDFVVHVNANAEGLLVGGYDIATDASLLGSRELGDRWMLIGGMLLNVTLQTYRGPMRIEPHAPVAMALLGLGLRL